MSTLLLLLGIALDASPSPDCTLLPLGDSARPTAVHVVFGPLPGDGDPRLIHHLEHLAVRSSTATCARSSGAELDAYTGPDTVHLIWRGQADAARAAQVAELLLHALSSPGDTSWGIAANEIAVEQALNESSASELLLRSSRALAPRYQLDLRGAVAPDLKGAQQELADSAVTVITAPQGDVVSWHTTLAPDTHAPILRETPPRSGAVVSWELRGTASCDDRRALWAALEGLAEASGGTAIGWVGHHTAVVGIADAPNRPTRKQWRQAIGPALTYDDAAVRMTARRARDVGDRSWMAAGHLGLGVCPAVTPLSAAQVADALGLLATGGPLTPPSSPEPLTLPDTDWASVWQAGEPPHDWTDPPHLFHTRTPGGFTVDGPAELLGTPPPPATHFIDVEDRVLEQVLTVLGAREQRVDCQWSPPSARPCETAGALRVPDSSASVIVDRPGNVVTVTEVRALPSGTGLTAHWRYDEAPDTDIRGYRHSVEPHRSFRRWSTPLSATPATLTLAPAPRLSSALEARLAARPWQAVHQPAGPQLPREAAITLLEDSPVVRIYEGPSKQLLSMLGDEVDRVWLPAQLEAEAEGIRSP